MYLGGKLVWRRDASGSVYFYFTDPLGTVRGIYTSGSSLCYDADFYPFGGEKVHTNTCAQNYKFTGLERDAESGLDDTLYRKYSSNLGRWLEVDPKRGCIAHPQGLNRYVYVADNPATFTDPSGLSYCDTHPDAVACNREPRLVEISDLGLISGDLGDLWDFGFDFGVVGGWLGGGGSEKTRTCTASPPPNYVGSPIGVPPTGGNLCTGTDHPYFWWAWQCTGDYPCCLAKQKPCLS
ncbi:MAG TPA: RHS repeat-associated core domain-containing protein [Terriglobia bacterium]|nr:RHS repeat-associated core domain-containing protein [Terriglobia bacterium]